MLAAFLIADVVLAVVLIENMQTFLLIIQQLEFKPTIAMATALAKQYITHSIGCCSGTRTGSSNHKMGHGLRPSARDNTMLDAGDNTINAAAVGISTPKNTV